MKVLVVGATGTLGSEIARKLIESGADVRAMARSSSDQATVEDLRAAGAEVITADIRDSQSVTAAVDGVEAVITTMSGMGSRWRPDNTIGDVDRDGVIRLIDAAEAAGISRFVHISFPHGSEPGFPLGDAKAAAENHLQKSTLTWTILASNYFMEVWLSPLAGFNYETGTPVIFGDGTNTVSWTSYHDTARAAVVALESEAAKNRVVPVGGPEALSPLEVVGIFEEATGKSWDPQFVSVDDLEAQKKAAPDEVQETFAGLQLLLARGSLAMKTSEYLISSGLRSVRAYAQGVA